MTSGRYSKDTLNNERKCVQGRDRDGMLEQVSLKSFTIHLPIHMFSCGNFPLTVSDHDSWGGNGNHVEQN